MKEATTFLTLLILSITLASAIPTLNIQQKETQPGETIFATISTTGEFISDILPENIKFLEGRKEVSFEHDITFHNGTFYLYAYTTREGNFTLKISDLLYKETSELESTTLEAPLEIKSDILADEVTNETYTKILSIKPGFIRATEQPKIKLSNVGTSPLNFTLEEEITLAPAQSIEITIPSEELFSYFKISTYKEFTIPIIRPAPEDVIIPRVEHDLKFSPDILLLELFTENKTKGTIEIFNFGDTNITDMKFNSAISFINIEEIFGLEARGTHNLSLEFSPKEQGHFQGNLNIIYTQAGKTKNLPIPLSLFVLPTGSSPEDFKISNDTCEEKGGDVCTSTETCDGKITFTKGQVTCCLANCVQNKLKKESKSIGWIIGIVILAALGGAGYYFYKKQKKVMPKKPEEQLKETSDKYSKRFEEINSPKRISGGIQRN